MTGHDLKNIGFTEGKALGLALDLVEKEYGQLGFDEKLSLLKKILDNPSSFINDTVLSPIATELLNPNEDTIALKKNSDG